MTNPPRYYIYAANGTPIFEGNGFATMQPAPEGSALNTGWYEAADIAELITELTAYRANWNGACDELATLRQDNHVLKGELTRLRDFLEGLRSDLANDPDGAWLVPRIDAKLTDLTTAGQ